MLAGLAAGFRDEQGAVALQDAARHLLRQHPGPVKFRHDIDTVLE